MTNKVLRLGLPFMLLAIGFAAYADRTDSADRADVDGRLQRCAFVADVTLLDQADMYVASGWSTFYARVNDSARGRGEGQVVVLAFDSIDVAEVHKRMLVFADEGVDGIYTVRLEHDCYVIGQDGTVAEHEGLIAKVVERLREQCDRHVCSVQLKLVESDLEKRHAGSPLRIRATLYNTGRDDLTIFNRLDTQHVPDHREGKLTARMTARNPTLWVMVDKAQREFAAPVPNLGAVEGHDMRFPAGNQASATVDIAPLIAHVTGKCEIRVWMQAGGWSSDPMHLMLASDENAPPRRVRKEGELGDERASTIFVVKRPDKPVDHVATDRLRADQQAILDLVLSDWLRTGADLGPGAERPVKAGDGVLLERRNLPPGYSPHVKGQTVIIADVPSGLRSDDYVVIADGDKKLRIAPHVLQFDSITLRGDEATVEISHNRHLNMGGVGATINLRRSKSGWKILPGRSVWSS
jgi:hypothetical protein